MAAKASAVVSKSGDCGMPSRTYKGQSADRPKLLWESKVKPDEQNPYQNEWNELVDAIRSDKPYNEVKRGVEASLVTSMGRKAAHTGQEITFDGLAQLRPRNTPRAWTSSTVNSPAPVPADAKAGILSRSRAGRKIANTNASRENKPDKLYPAHSVCRPPAAHGVRVARSGGIRTLAWQNPPGDLHT